MDAEKDLRALMLFVEIVDAGNLSEAARRMRMSRANVSYRLAQFERILGHELLRRTTRSIEPTEIGQRLYEHGCVVRDELKAVRDSITLSSQELRGRVRLSVPSGYGSLVMQDWLFAFKRLHPGIVLDVMFENRVEDLMRDEVDVAVRVMSEPPQSLVARDLGEVRYVVCASSTWASKHGMPEQLDDLSRLPVLTSAVQGRELRLTAYQGAERHRIPLKPTLVSENFMFLRGSILADLGIGIVPEYVVRNELRTGEVMEAFANWRLSIFGTHMYMLYMPGRLRTKSITAFINFIVDRSKEGWSGEATARSLSRVRDRAGLSDPACAKGPEKLLVRS